MWPKDCKTSERAKKLFYDMRVAVEKDFAGKAVIGQAKQEALVDRWRKLCGAPPLVRLPHVPAFSSITTNGEPEPEDVKPSKSRRSMSEL